MKVVILKIGIAILNVIYCLIKLFPIQKNKITLISRQSNEISIDFTMIAEQLRKKQPTLKLVFLCKTLEKGMLAHIDYFFSMFQQMYHIATSKTVILDSYCIPICILKQKKKLIVIQIWHALGSLKKFGYSSLDKKDGRNSKIAKAMKMHRNYTYILTSSETSKPFFQEAFDAKEEQMKVMNLPRVDFLQSEKAKQRMLVKFYELYPEANNAKKNILYCPTQRKLEEIPVRKMVEQIPLEKYNFIAKLHDGTETVFVKDKNVQKNCYFTGMELLHVADYIITDYSAIVYEAAITKKPIYFYAYDYETYMSDRGTYIDYQAEMPGPICEDFQDILTLMEQNFYDAKKNEEFCNKFVANLNENATEKLVNFILEGKDT